MLLVFLFNGRFVLFLCAARMRYIAYATYFLPLPKQKPPKNGEAFRPISGWIRVWCPIVSTVMSVLNSPSTPAIFTDSFCTATNNKNKFSVITNTINHGPQHSSMVLCT
ncbi:hypothetical protein EDC01DRAFT_91710 [Geopyxis carbonaria]|nr:hypothetical protein EDC01DRAFT_91710 [Geopyxis carbonaria]